MNAECATRSDGFTLLEVVVALAIAAVALIGLFQAGSGGLFAVDTAGRGASGALKLEGRSDSLTFVGDLPTGLGTTRRANITLELVHDRLVLRWTPHRHELTNAPEPEPVETELIRGVVQVEFAYWGAPAADQAAGWQTQWASLALPELIRVRLAFAKDDRRRWPDLITAPRR